MVQTLRPCLPKKKIPEGKNEPFRLIYRFHVFESSSRIETRERPATTLFRGTYVAIFLSKDRVLRFVDSTAVPRWWQMHTTHPADAVQLRSQTLEYDKSCSAHQLIDISTDVAVFGPSSTTMHPRIFTFISFFI